MFFVCAFSESAGQHFEQSLNTYKNFAGPQDSAFLTVQDDFCRFLLFSGQKEVFNAHSHTHTMWNHTPKLTCRCCYLSTEIFWDFFKPKYQRPSLETLNLWIVLACLIDGLHPPKNTDGK